MDMVNDGLGIMIRSSTQCPTPATGLVRIDLLIGVDSSTLIRLGSGEQVKIESLLLVEPSESFSILIGLLWDLTCAIWVLLLSIQIPFNDTVKVGFDET